MHDVYIVDEEFDAADKLVAEICGAIDTQIEQYLHILKHCTDEGLMEGETAASFRAFAEYAEKLRGYAARLAGNHRSAEKNFLTEIDDTDTYLYD